MYERGWNKSQIRITCALALNEIVNAPWAFVSRSPHLVVDKLDWISTRYLFVQTATIPRENLSGLIQPVTKPSQPYEQDPQMTPMGQDGPIIIPANAVGHARSRTIAVQSPKSRFKRVKTGMESDAVANAYVDSDDGVSICTLGEDRAILVEDNNFDPPMHRVDNEEPNLSEDQTSTVQPNLNVTQFQPGTLDHSTLPLLAPPSYATSSASKQLLRHYNTLLQIQSQTPLHELGWYIDPERFENLYQWIVQLHSFDTSLKLADDMKKQGVQSIVVEMRFGKDYPFSPPFVRVIRPRFLSLMQGGGGHVTAGGAICMEVELA